MVRKWHRGELPPDALDPALEVINQHRAAHTQPLLTANVALRRHCEKVGEPPQVTQRLKKTQTIIEKLTERESGMNLARMQDIAGVRAVVGSVSKLRLVRDHIVDRRAVISESDYLETPRTSGYRAIHLVIEFGTAVRKPVEIQLRTFFMQQWAEMVESLSGMMGVNYKHDGNTAFHEWARLESEILALTEAGVRPPQELEGHYNQALEVVVKQMSERQGER